jgi:uncharacterized membrane protein
LTAANPGIKVTVKYVLAAFFVLAGFNHFRNEYFYVTIMPPYLPWHLFLVYLSGFFEIAFGILLAIPRQEAIAAWGLIALLIAVFPANIHMAVHAELYPQFSATALWARLPLQAILIAWTYWYTKKSELQSSARRDPSISN